MKLIDADKLKNIYKYNSSDNLHPIIKRFLSIVMKDIESMPKVDILLCRDCKYYEWISGGFCNRLENETGHPMNVSGSDFCSFGRKKDDSSKD